MSRLEEILQLAKHVPPFPKVAQRVLAMIEVKGVKAKELAEVIQYDAAITANVLKSCNAAYFGLPRKVSSLDEALVVIGHDVLKDIIITSTSARFYKGKVGEGYCLEQGELWKHSVASGIMAKRMVPFFKGVDGGTAFTTALLHDIGKRFLSAFVADEFEAIMRKVGEENCSFVAAEKEILGATHADLGAMILEKWEFPAEMIEAVKLHHDPEAMNGSPLTALIALSNALVITMGVGVGADGLASEIQGAALKRFGISDTDLQLCMADLLVEMEKAEELFNL